MNSDRWKRRFKYPIWSFFETTLHPKSQCHFSTNSVQDCHRDKTTWRRKGWLVGWLLKREPESDRPVSPKEFLTLLVQVPPTTSNFQVWWWVTFGIYVIMYIGPLTINPRDARSTQLEVKRRGPWAYLLLVIITNTNNDGAVASRKALDSYGVGRAAGAHINHSGAGLSKEGTGSESLRLQARHLLRSFVRRLAKSG